MVLAPEVVIVGLPVDIPEYLAVGTEIMTTPEPPLPVADPVALPPPPKLAVEPPPVVVEP